jgi:ubiquinone/menaquinone biosynthesis C-methylase UbiE
MEDASGRDPEELAGALRDLARMNRRLGGTALTLDALGGLTRGLPAGYPLRVLDVATGGGDVPLDILRWATGRGFRPRVVAADLDPEVASLAERWCGGRVEVCVADARALPFPDGSFDVAVCSLMLHHLEPEEAVATLAGMGRVARIGVVVNDVVRSWAGLAVVGLATRLVARSPMTRHDGPLSVRRAYTVDELRRLARRAGLRTEAVRGIPGVRVALRARCGP